MVVLTWKQKVSIDTGQYLNGIGTKSINLKIWYGSGNTQTIQKPES